MSEKITGYLLLFIGIFLIIISVISVFNVFTGKAKPYPLLQLSGVSMNLGEISGVKLPSQEIISPAMLNDSGNLFIHLLLMGFIASTGQKLASLGVQLVRPIVVKLNEPKTV